MSHALGTQPGTGDDGTVWLYNESTDHWDLANLASAVQTTVLAIKTYASSHTLALVDSGAFVSMTSGSANNLTVPPNSSVAFPVGAFSNWGQKGAGLLTIVAGAGVTIRSRGGLLNSAGQYARGDLLQVAADEWWLAGDLA